MDPTTFGQLASHYGVPVALLAVVLYYHVRVVKEKDAEIARLNEARVGESRNSAQRVLEQNRILVDTMRETNNTLRALQEKL